LLIEEMQARRQELKTLQEMGFGQQNEEFLKSLLLEPDT